MRTEEEEQGEHSQSVSHGDETVKRLDFEDISVTNSTMHDLRLELLRIRRGLDECREVVPNQTEFLEPFRRAATEFESDDISKLSETYTQLKLQYIRLEAENKFLEPYLGGNSAPGNVSDKDLDILQRQLSEVHAKSREEMKEIESLMAKFASEMEEFPETLMESALDYVDECDEKMRSWEEQAKDDTIQRKSIVSNAEIVELDSKARELSKLVGNVELEILELNNRTFNLEKHFNQLKSLRAENRKLELLNELITFFSDWKVIDLENGEVTMIFKGLTPQTRRSGQVTRHNKHHKMSNASAYKLRLKVNEKTLFVEDIQLEPVDDVPIEDIVQELAFRRTMHSLEASTKPHNDVEFVLRKISQRLLVL